MVRITSTTRLLVIFLIVETLRSSLAFTGIEVALGLGALSAAGSMFFKGYCRLAECCHQGWTAFNITHLKEGLDAVVFGQHIVNDIVHKNIYQHAMKENPDKALLLSFHGGIGTGKNHVADVKVKHLYPRGVNSRYVHNIISSHEFMHPTEIQTYQQKLKDRIMKGVKDCGRSIFIIDEVEKMPPGLLDVIKPFVDYHSHIDGVDYRGAIFLLLGNVAGREINKIALKHMKTGKAREKLSRKDMHYSLRELSMSKLGGLENSNIVRSELIDWFVPFLPLEKSHVKMCVKTELGKYPEAKRLINDAVLEEIANELAYVPDDNPVFSSSGCKRIEKIVARYVRANA